ncbi:1-phosphofructokinase family hexose kinase [Nioella nitratireducens]|uniref:1-phosphofructokinase family hexose kinase n=1 Tax=Nioella nitratireducens TaxID=1287720 RepID=UPI0008FD6B29|nr:1-phosphofructokinase family hexose kinase [Nioella nitratireducens]
MTPILTITLNPAVDLETATQSLTPGPKLRCDPPQLDPGGGGINVSRALSELGGDSLALVASGGGMGAVLEGLLSREGVRVRRLEAPGETRQSLSVFESGTGKQFRFIFPGPDWTEADVARAETRIAETIPTDGLVVLSGSHPPGFPDDFPARLVARCNEVGARVVLDTSGAALRALSAGRISGLDVLRLDLEEAETLAGHRLPSAGESADLADALRAKGVARVVVLARGAEGSVLVSETGRWLARAADVPVRSKTGAGDSFVAGFTLGLSRGEPLPDCLQRGAAAASAAVMTGGTRLCRREDAERLMAECPVQRL